MNALSEILRYIYLKIYAE